MRDEGEGGKRYGFPLDEALGLRPHQEETEWVRERGVELACDHPYRQAAELLGEEIGKVVSHRTLHPGGSRMLPLIEPMVVKRLAAATAALSPVIRRRYLLCAQEH